MQTLWTLWLEEKDSSHEFSHNVWFHICLPTQIRSNKSGLAAKLAGNWLDSWGVNLNAKALCGCKIRDLFAKLDQNFRRWKQDKNKLQAKTFLTQCYDSVAVQWIVSITKNWFDQNQKFIFKFLISRESKSSLGLSLINFVKLVQDQCVPKWQPWNNLIQKRERFFLKRSYFQDEKGKIGQETFKRAEFSSIEERWVHAVHIHVK